MTSTLYRHLRISDGRKDLSAKDMRILVDLINFRLPNLDLLHIQAVDPGVENWPHVRYPGLLIDALGTLAAMRPLARLDSWPFIFVKPRVRFYQAHDSFRLDPHMGIISQPSFNMT
jgi:hypothetical protein